MDKPHTRSSQGDILLPAAAVVVIVAGMRAAEPIIVPLLLSLFIAIIAAPSMFWLQRKGVPHVLALVVVITGMFFMVIGMMALVGSSLQGFTRELPGYQARIREQETALTLWLATKGIEIPPDQVLRFIDPGRAMALVASLLNGLGSVLTNSFLIFLTVIFLLMEAPSFPAKLHAVLDDPQASLGRLEMFLDNVKRYLAIKTSTSLLTGVAIGLWLLLVGVDYPVLWGLFAFLLNYIPNIGSIIAAVPTILLALVQLGAGAAAWVALGYLVVNNLVGNLIEPRFMGRGLGLSTLVVFVSLVFWGWVFGAVGMFLAVPLTMMAKIALDSLESTRWVAILLGPEIPPQKVEAQTGTGAKGPGPDAPQA